MQSGCITRDRRCFFFSLSFSIFIIFSFLFFFSCSTSLDDLSKIDSKGWRVVRPWKRAGTLRKVSNFLLLRCHLPVRSHSFQSKHFLPLLPVKDYAPEIIFLLDVVRMGRIFEGTNILCILKIFSLL